MKCIQFTANSPSLNTGDPEDRQFQLWTDHRPLTYALSRCTDAWTPRQQRQLSYIAEYTADIQYVPGVENVVADTLSRPPATEAQPTAAVTSLLPAGDAQQPQAASLCVRPPAAVISLPSDPVLHFIGGGVDVAALAAAQPYCKEVTAMKQLPSLRVSSFKFLDHELFCDFSTSAPRLLLPLPSICRCSHPLPSWNLEHQASDVRKMGLGWHGSRQSAMVQQLSALPAGQGDQAATRSSPAHPHPHQEILSCPY